MDGYIAVTDPDWFGHLSRDPTPRDANFWRPSARRRRLPIGAPFIFKLTAPHSAIVGFGYFVGFSVLPDWLAWDTFGEANGVGSLGELRARLSTIQARARIVGDPAGRIGCCLIAEARFFSRDSWVTPPKDWPPHTQSGAGYDLTRGEGRRVWHECLEHGDGRRDPLSVRDVVQPARRYGAPVLHLPRLGQGIFRISVIDAYDRGCAVTREHSLPVLEAAHLRPFASGGAHAVPNGVLLRSDLHRLLDRGYITIDEDHRLVVGRRLKDEFANGKCYYGLHGQPLAVPAHEGARLAPASLAWHRERVFLG